MQVTRGRGISVTYTCHAMCPNHLITPCCSSCESLMNHYDNHQACYPLQTDELTPLHYFDQAPKHKPAIAWIPRVAHAPPFRDVDPRPHVRLIMHANKVIKASVEHLCGRKGAVICAVHDGTLSREAVEDESCVFGGCGDGKERVVLGGIRGVDPGR